MAQTTAGRLLVGRYRLKAPLGQGGMGIVWAARDELLGREVAVKEVVLPPGLNPHQQRNLRKRTLREARAAARIASPAAVTVYDVVVEDDQPWIVMQKLPPRTLADVLRDDGPLPPDQVARIGLWLLDALTAAHRAGVLHRDVKPANVMFSEDGRAVLTDFGIAALDGDPTLTTAGMLVGSPAYMAPERARGDPPTPASDLWSLGATLFAALEGQSPFQRDGQLPTLTAIVTEEPPRVSNARALGPVIDRLLAKNPADRPDPAEVRLLLTRAAAFDAPPDVAPAAPPPASARTEAPPPASPPPTAPSPPTPPPPPAPTLPTVPPIAAAAPPAASPPATRPPAARPSDPARRRGGRRWLVAALAAVLVGLAAIPVYDGLFEAGEQAREPAAPPAGAARSPSPTGPASTTPSASAQPPAAGATGGGKGQSQAAPKAPAVPAGFRLVRDPTGFRIAVPRAWERSKQGTRTYFREPSGGRFLQVDQTTEPRPDALADWKQQEEIVSQRLNDYERVRIEPVDYRGWDAVDWEFTWLSGNGRLHVLNRNIRVSDERAYALYWSAPAGKWEDSRELFDVFARTFQPAS